MTEYFLEQNVLLSFHLSFFFQKSPVHQHAPEVQNRVSCRYMRILLQLGYRECFTFYQNESWLLNYHIIRFNASVLLHILYCYNE